MPFDKAALIATITSIFEDLAEDATPASKAVQISDAIDVFAKSNNVRRTVTAPYVVVDDDCILNVVGSGLVILTDPTDARALRIRNGSSGAIILIAAAGSNINGEATYILRVAEETVDIIGDGVCWGLY